MTTEEAILLVQLEREPTPEEIKVLAAWSVDCQISEHVGWYEHRATRPWLDRHEELISATLFMFNITRQFIQTRTWKKERS